MAVITGGGMSQGDLVTFLTNTVTICNELKDDVDKLKLTVDALTQKLDADAGITDTNYEAVVGVGGSDDDAAPAPLTAADLALTGL